MSDMFCPEGFMSVNAAIVKAAHFWFPEPLEKAVPKLATSEGSVDAAVQALLQLNRAEWPEPLRDAFAQTRIRLRNSLHQGKIKAYYFSENGLQSIGQHFWAIAEADDVLELGLYWPNGDPSRMDEQRPNAVFFMQSELGTLLSKRRRRFPPSKISELADAYRKLVHLPNRQEQRDVILKMPAFERFRITERIFRQAERQVSRASGKQPRQ